MQSSKQSCSSPNKVTLMCVVCQMCHMFLFLCDFSHLVSNICLSCCFFFHACPCRSILNSFLFLHLWFLYFLSPPLHHLLFYLIHMLLSLVSLWTYLACSTLLCSTLTLVQPSSRTLSTARRCLPAITVCTRVWPTSSVGQTR